MRGLKTWTHWRVFHYDWKGGIDTEVQRVKHTLGKILHKLIQDEGEIIMKKLLNKSDGLRLCDACGRQK